MSANWMRYFDLVIDGSNGNSLRLNDFKVTFTVTSDVTKNGSEARVTVYNLKQSTCNAIMKGEYTRLKIVAGYSGIAPDVDNSQVGKVYSVPALKAGQARGMNYGEIFSGEIRYAFSGKKDQDTTLVIQALDGHQAMLETTLNTTLAAGHSAESQLALTLRNFNPFGITAGVTGAMPPTRFPRGKVLYQAAHQVMDNIAAQCRASWQFVDGKLQMVPEDNYLQQQVVLNSQSGLIGAPKLMMTGIEITCLINPNIRLHGTVQVDQAMLTQAWRADEAVVKSVKAADGTVDKTVQKPADIAADGTYIVNGISCNGDTREKTWYMTLTCIPRDKQTPLPSGAL